MVLRFLQLSQNSQLTAPVRSLLNLNNRPATRQSGQIFLSPRNQINRFHRKNTRLIEERLVEAGAENGNHRGLLKPILFTAGFTVSAFVGVTIWEYEAIRARAIRSIKRPFSSIRDSLARQNVPAELNQMWERATPGERFFAPICAVNLLVFGLWRVPRLQTVMSKYFLSNPLAKAVCWPMFLSTFSHYSTYHILANMFVLHSFSNTFCSTLGKEQALAVYLSAGVFASLASYCAKFISRTAGGSLGASGAIMAMLAYICTKYPDSKLSIILLPMFTFTAGTAIKVIIGVDLAGCILGWKFFDHAAHLGGAMFGLFWVYVGQEKLWPRRAIVIENWHKLRSGVK